MSGDQGEDNNIARVEVQKSVDAEEDGLEPEDQAKILHNEEMLSGITAEAVKDAA